MELPHKGENIYISINLLYIGTDDQIMLFSLSRQPYLYEKLNGCMLWCTTEKKWLSAGFKLKKKKVGIIMNLTHAQEAIYHFKNPSPFFGETHV